MRGLGSDTVAWQEITPIDRAASSSGSGLLLNPNPGFLCIEGLPLGWMRTPPFYRLTRVLYVIKPIFGCPVTHRPAGLIGTDA